MNNKEFACNVERCSCGLYIVNRIMCVGCEKAMLSDLLFRIKQELQVSLNPLTRSISPELAEEILERSFESIEESRRRREPRAQEGFVSVTISDPASNPDLQMAQREFQETVPAEKRVLTTPADLG